MIHGVPGSLKLTAAFSSQECLICEHTTKENRESQAKGGVLGKLLVDGSNDSSFLAQGCTGTRTARISDCLRILSRTHCGCNICRREISSSAPFVVTGGLASETGADSSISVAKVESLRAVWRQMGLEREFGVWS
jgi:hypothetical protein